VAFSGAASPRTVLIRRVVLVTGMLLTSIHCWVPAISASQRVKVNATGVEAALVVGAAVSFFWYGSFASGIAAKAEYVEIKSVTTSVLKKVFIDHPMLFVFLAGSACAMCV
jgi:hypothetical protein